MRTAFAIARKELSLYFATPVAYISGAAMLGLTAFFFVGYLQTFLEVQLAAREDGWPALGPDAAPYRNLTDGVVIQLWGVMLVLTLIISPFLTMRLFSEEKRQKTFELLMTAPVRPIEIVLGKYLGGLGVITAILTSTLVFPLTLSAFGFGQSGSALEWSTVWLGFFAMLLWGATCVAIGMFLSALTESQVLAAFLTLAVLLPWMMLGGLSYKVEEPWRSILRHLSFESQLQHLMAGVFDPKAVVFFASVVFFSLLLSHRAVEAQRWS